MALTNEVLKANADLAGLTDAQLSVITTLSANDENVVIGKKIGDIYREMDSTILKETGVARNGDEKTYNYLARATQQLKGNTDVTTLNQTIADLNKEKARLEKVIQDGNKDSETAKQLTAVKAELESTKTLYNDLKTQTDTATQKHAKELLDMTINNDLSAAKSGLKFKPEFPATVTDVIVNQAIEKIKAMNPDYIDNGNGGKVLVFRGKDGAVLNNPENKLNPFTASELVLKELKTSGILLEGRQQSGAGTGNNGNDGNKSTVDISGAKTKTEAMKIAKESLMAKGLTVGSDAYQKELDTIWKENDISKLPVQ